MELEGSVNELAPCIYSVREQQVMLDFDLAKIYGIETKQLKRAVRNNPRKFPEDFVFELTQEEIETLQCKNFTQISPLHLNTDDKLKVRCKNCTEVPDADPNADVSSNFGCNNCTEISKNCSNAVDGLAGSQAYNLKPGDRLRDFRRGDRYAPFAFTESGVGMLSGVLRSDRALQANIQLMRSFRQGHRQLNEPQGASPRNSNSLENRLDALEGKIDKLTDYLCRQTPSASQLPETERVSVIQNVVAQHWGITVEDLKSADRSHSFMLPRHVAIYLVRNHLGLSLNEIGRHFGGRDHTTILNALRKIERLSSINKLIDSLTSSIQ
jgi:hypothetical protein